MTSKSGIKALTEELKKHRGANPELEKLIDLYEEIFKVQESIRPKAGSAPVLSPGEALAKLLSGQYIIEKKALQIDPELYRETALALGKIFSRVSGRPFPVEELLSLPRLKPEAASKFAADILANKVDYVKKFAKSSDFNEETIFFFLLSLIVPFFQGQAEYYKEIIKDAGWKKGSCPFCGSPPLHARLEGKDSQRFLYCPLCRSGIVYDRRLGGEVLSFGNTSALYESDLVMVDRGTGSYWWQVAGTAIVGPLTGAALEPLPSTVSTWEDWIELYPDTLLLSRDTGHERP